MPSPQLEHHLQVQQQQKQSHSILNDSIKYLQSLKSIRETCEKVYNAVQSGHPEARFKIDETKLSDVADFVADVIRKDYVNPKKDIPPHSRWRHFLPAGSVESLIVTPLKLSSADSDEIVTKSLLDLFVISVLLDAGAGDKWKYYRSGMETGLGVGRSEGLAMASMDMFIEGIFSGDELSSFRVDADALMNLKMETLSKGLQVDIENNPLIGLDGRLELLKRLGKVLKNPINQRFFYNPHDSSYRPGNLIYFLLQNSQGNQVEIEKLWQVVIEGFGGVWPVEGRLKIEDVCLGDVWPSKILILNSKDQDSLVTFHKLSQWLTYSLIEPIEMFLNLKFLKKEQMTGLAEYRNGGLFVDLKVIIPIESISENVEYNPDDEIIIQWRALTICLLDRLAPILRERLDLSAEEFSLPKMLEGGTWKAGRIVAKLLRPDTCSPPIKIKSDGTLF